MGKKNCKYEKVSLEKDNIKCSCVYFKKSF